MNSISLHSEVYLPILPVSTFAKRKTALAGFNEAFLSQGSPLGGKRYRKELQPRNRERPRRGVVTVPRSHLRNQQRSAAAKCETLEKRVQGGLRQHKEFSRGGQGEEPLCGEDAGCAQLRKGHFFSFGELKY